jgi:hypothetical protein
MLNQKYFDICNNTVNDVMGEKSEGDVTTANQALSKLLVENTDLKMYLSSVGKSQEYIAWIKRFKAKYGGIENCIKDNLELEEV